MRQNSVSIRPFEAKRVRVESSRSFEDVLLHLQEVVGTAPNSQGSGQEADSAPAREQLDQITHSLGSSDFTRLFVVDWGRLLPLFGIQRKVVRWILGNPQIAITMIQHDITAALFAPVELLLVENVSGEGSTVIYDVPSSLTVLDPNPALEAAARALDGKLQALVSYATGVTMDQ